MVRAGNEDCAAWQGQRMAWAARGEGGAWQGRRMLRAAHSEGRAWRECAWRGRRMDGRYMARAAHGKDGMRQGWASHLQIDVLQNRCHPIRSKHREDQVGSDGRLQQAGRKASQGVWFPGLNPM
eukprot:358777-Chlamydomonas_euryale.AAC.5